MSTEMTAEREREIRAGFTGEIDRLRIVNAETLRVKRMLFDSKLEVEKERDQLREKIAVAEEALEFYRDGSSWTTNDDEFLFIKIVDSDWMKSISGNFVGGMRAYEALAKIRGEKC